VITVAIPTIEPRTGCDGPFARALQSAQTQTLKPHRILAQLDADREGAAATRNRALEAVDTEWVAFLDDDDELYPDHLRLCARAARLNGADVVYPGYDTAGGDDPVGCFGIPFDGDLLQRRNFIPVTVLARTALVREAGGFQARPDEHGDPCEDWGLWLAMHRQGARFYHLPQKTWRWNLAPGSTRGRPDRW
jgi:glycosyltransferase involved in cell wall biosynthesis